MATHANDNPIWDRTVACEVSIDTVNSKETLAGIHIVEQLPEYILCRPNPSYELLTVDAYTPPDSSEDDRMYQLIDNYNKWDKSLNKVGVNNMGSSHIFTTDSTSDSTNDTVKSDFWISKRQS